MQPFAFKLKHTDGAARLGELRTPHGLVETPAFMPVGTQGAVKALRYEDVERLGAQVILGNTYHLFLRPGDELIARRGGLHKFIGWDRPILTDSGGYPVFSPAARRVITEGGVFQDLRDESADATVALEFEGYAIGGLSVGEPIDMMYSVVGDTARRLPDDRPRYLMGTGTPGDLVECVARGIDMFDCVLPTRNARNGQLFTSEGRLNIKNARFAEDDGPLDPQCGCYTCRTHSRAYLRHLYMAGEMSAGALNTLQ